MEGALVSGKLATDAVVAARYSINFPAVAGAVMR
jgi:hypothetical protein